MKISRSQRFLAYTLETEPGSETYIAYVDDLHAGTEQILCKLASIFANTPAVGFEDKGGTLCFPTGTTVDIIPDVHGIEFAGDDKSILYTASHSSAAGRPSKVGK